jgi:hypothetical protein
LPCLSTLLAIMGSMDKAILNSVDATLEGSLIAINNQYRQADASRAYLQLYASVRFEHGGQKGGLKRSLGGWRQAPTASYHQDESPDELSSEDKVQFFLNWQPPEAVSLTFESVRYEAQTGFAAGSVLVSSLAFWSRLGGGGAK